MGAVSQEPLLWLAGYEVGLSPKESADDSRRMCFTNIPGSLMSKKKYWSSSVCKGSFIIYWWSFAQTWFYWTWGLMPPCVNHTVTALHHLCVFRWFVMYLLNKHYNHPVHPTPKSWILASLKRQEAVFFMQRSCASWLPANTPYAFPGTGFGISLV